MTTSEIKVYERKHGIFAGYPYTKTENFDFNEYIFLSMPESEHVFQLTSTITKQKGERPTDEDVAHGFAIDLFEEMIDYDFNEKNAEKWFKGLPQEFYTQETYNTICKEMAQYEEKAPVFEKDRLEKNLGLFKRYHKQVNTVKDVVPPKPVCVKPEQHAQNRELAHS